MYDHFLSSVKYTYYDYNAVAIIESTVEKRDSEDQSYRHNSWEEHEKRRYSFKEQAIKSMTLFFVVATCILFYFALLRLGQISSVF